MSACACSLIALQHQRRVRRRRQRHLLHDGHRLPVPLLQGGRDVRPGHVDAATEPAVDAIGDAPPACARRTTTARSRSPRCRCPGPRANFRIATNATFNTAGTSNTDGSRTWDLSVALANDADQDVALASPAGAWWQPDFPRRLRGRARRRARPARRVPGRRAPASRCSASSRPTAARTKTELDYDPPARISRSRSAPARRGPRRARSRATRRACFVAYTEKYTSRVDQVGTMKTPYGTFPVLRVATDLTRTGASRRSSPSARSRGSPSASARSRRVSCARRRVRHRVPERRGGAETRAVTRALVVACSLALAGCPRFHAEPLRGRARRARRSSTSTACTSTTREIGQRPRGRARPRLSARRSRAGPRVAPALASDATA